MAVHNHGTEEGEGLACKEIWVIDELGEKVLQGICLNTESGIEL